MARLASTIEQPLALRLRPDLTATPIEMGGAMTWIVTDPVALEHFQFSAEEYALIARLRQSSSLGDLQRAFAQQYAPQTIRPEAVWNFLRRLHSAGLLMAETRGTGDELVALAKRERLRRIGLAWTQLLAIRFRGIDPNEFLTKAHQRTGWLFGRLAILFVATVVLYAGAIVVGHFGQLVAHVGQLSALADARNVLWLLGTIGLVKVLHELGHALVCKHFGGEVHELGFMLLAFSPCLYCDVSDAWRMSSKWQRIAVSSAGIAVELVLASIATIVWWHSQAGFVNLMALNVMVVCTVGTVLVNGNPLMRYDGYYILSDLLDIPNLWQRSREVLARLLCGWFRDETNADDPLLPKRHRPWLAAYALASKVYVALVCVMVVWALVVVLYPLRLQVLAYAVGLTMFASALVGPIASGARLVTNPTYEASRERRRLAIGAALGLSALLGVLAIPVNYYVQAPLVVMPASGARVYATVEGTLAGARRVGEVVEAGEAIAELTNRDLELELQRLEGDCTSQAQRLTHLERLRAIDVEANDKIPAARAALSDLQRRLEERRRDAARLSVTAPVAGTILPAPRVPPQDDEIGRLSTWSGSILDPSNSGAHVEVGTLVCLVGDPAQDCALLFVEDSDVKRIVPGQSVRMRVDQLPGKVLTGEVVEVARHEARDPEREGAARGELAAMFAGIVAPGEATKRYEVRVKFDDGAPDLVIGGRGTGKVASERISLARWIVRFLGQTFRLPM